MSSSQGVLAQVLPNPGILATLFTGTAAKKGTVKLIVCNTSSIDLVRVAVSPGGAAIQSKHYLAYDMPIDANESLSSTGFMIKEGDVVRVYSANGNVAFTLTGLEEDLTNG